MAKNKHRFREEPKKPRFASRRQKYERQANPGNYAYANEYAAAQKSKRSPSSILGIVLLVVGIALLVVAAFLYIQSEREYAAGRAIYQEAAKLGPDWKFSEQLAQQGNTGELPLLDFEPLWAENEDIVAWITAPSLGINYPVVQAEDNDYYLRRALDGSYNKAGTLFMDYASDPKIEDKHTIIYGHNMRDGSMFKPIMDLTDQGTFDAKRTIILYTPYKTYLLETVAVYQTVGSDTTVRKFEFANDTEFHSYIQSKFDSAIVRDPEITADSIPHLFSFSTCSYNVQDGRTIMLATEKPVIGDTDTSIETTIGPDGQPIITEETVTAEEATEATSEN